MIIISSHDNELHLVYTGLCYCHWSVDILDCFFSFFPPLLLPLSELVELLFRPTRLLTTTSTGIWIHDVILQGIKDTSCYRNIRQYKCICERGKYSPNFLSTNGCLPSKIINGPPMSILVPLIGKQLLALAYQKGFKLSSLVWMALKWTWGDHLSF